MLRLLLFAITMGVAIPALAQTAAYPKDVQAVFDFHRKACMDDGGTDATFSDEDVRKVDLNGDGRDDYIVHLQNAECLGNLGAFCGTGGCGMSILIARKNGSFDSIFDQPVRGYTIAPGRGARTIRFQLHGGYCGGAGNPSCYKNRRITGREFEFVQPQ